MVWFKTGQFINGCSAFQKPTYFNVIGGAEFFRSACHANLPFMQQHHPIGDPEGKLDIVGDDDAGQLKCILQSPNQLSDDIAPNWIESCGRFVIQNDVRFQDDCSGQRHTFSLPSGKRGGVNIVGPGHSDHVQHPLNTSASFFRGGIGVFTQREAHILTNRHGVEQRALLKQETDSSSDIAESRLLELINACLIEVDLAGISMEQPNQVFEHDTLATSAWTHDDRGLTGIERQSQATQDMISTKPLVQILHLHDRLFLVM